MKVTIYCCLCQAKHESEIELSAGWAHQYGEIDDDRSGFCPKHAPVAAFTDAQCPGCVGGWGDCPMWQAFAYSGRSRTVGPDDFAKLERGICPRRVNGTIGINKGRMEDLNLSERAPDAAGSAFAQAIKDYCARYSV